MNYYKYIVKLLLKVVLSSVVLISCQNEYSSIDNIKLLPVDTIIIPGNSSKKQISQYNKKSNSNILTYIDYTNKYLVQLNSKKIDRVIDFSKLFNKAGKYRLIQHFFYLNKKNDIYLLAKPIKLKKLSEKNLETKRDFVLFRIDSTNQIIDKIKINNDTKRNFYIQSPLIQYPIITNKDSSVFVCAVTVGSNPGETPINDYQINNNSRIKKFSQDCAMLIVIKNNNEAYFMSKNISYPKIFLDTSIYFYDYFPSIVAKPNNDILTLYYDLDTLYSYNISSEVYSKHPFDSKYHTAFKSFDKSKIYDYDYINKYACESTSNIYLKQNNKTNQTYIIISKALKYENEDGTINKASNNPFSIIVLDSNYSQLGEFNISPDYIKHDCFAYGNGIAFLNTKLSTQDSNKYLYYVVFETKLQ